MLHHRLPGYIRWKRAYLVPVFDLTFNLQDISIVPLGGIINNMKRVFKTRHFSRWLRKTELTDGALCLAVAEMVQGLIDADLGAGVVKKRIALPGRGKSGGARTLLATNKGTRWFFLFGFEKNERANVAEDELAALRELATDLLMRTNTELDTAVVDGTLLEICNGH
jgi:hypothetical protein